MGHRVSVLRDAVFARERYEVLIVCAAPMSGFPRRWKVTHGTALQCFVSVLRRRFCAFRATADLSLWRSRVRGARARVPQHVRGARGRAVGHGQRAAGRYGQ